MTVSWVPGGADWAQFVDVDDDQEYDDAIDYLQTLKTRGLDRDALRSSAGHITSVACLM